MSQTEWGKASYELLETGLGDLQVSLSSHQKEQALIFLKELKKWNAAYNLTAIDEWEAMITLHLLDSFAVMPFIEGETVLDIGTGAGIPGIPLAIAMPDKHFTLVDSNGKKIRFIRHVIRVLEITNVTALHSRAEDLSTSTTYDVIMARAVSSLLNIIQMTQHVLKDSGEYVLMKGTKPVNELNQLDGEVRCHEIGIPGLSAQRHVIQIKSK